MISTKRVLSSVVDNGPVLILRCLGRSAVDDNISLAFLESRLCKFHDPPSWSYIEELEQLRTSYNNYSRIHHGSSNTFFTCD